MVTVCPLKSGYRIIPSNTTITSNITSIYKNVYIGDHLRYILNVGMRPSICQLFVSDQVPSVPLYWKI